MRNFLSALAVTAFLALNLTGGAQAQTISGSGPAGSFVVDLLQSSVSYPAYTYNYVATLDSITPGADVTRFQFDFQEPVLFESATDGFVTSDPTTGSLFTFTSPTGLSTQGDQATFKFYSPDPPNGYVGVGSTSPGVGGSGYAFGPLPCNCAVPEPASLALLGLGALPLGLLVRRRMAAK